MERDPIRTLIADDHDPLRAELREELAGEGFDVVAEADNGLDAACLALAATPQLCVLDVQMPWGGVDAARAIVDALPGTTVVMLTATRDEATALAALGAGASGYLLKDAAPEQLAA